MKRSLSDLRPGWQSPLMVAGVLALLVAVWFNRSAPNLTGAPRGEEKGAGAGNAAPAEPSAVEIRFSDNSVLKLALQTNSITLNTRYGSLSIPVSEIQKIEFATRIPPQVAKQIEAAIKNLGSGEFKEREKASAELSRIGILAYPSLVEAANSADAEVKRGAEELIAKIKDSVPAEALEVRQHDVIHTRDSKITGKVETALFKANTVPFGDVQIKLADMRGLRSLAYVEPEKDKLVAMPDPGHLQNFANQFGKKLAFTVTGRADGTIWGTNVYTLDSALATAAVHAGVLAPGQTGVVKVQIIPSPPAFAATNQNGIQSQPWQVYQGGAYQILPKTR